MGFVSIMEKERNTDEERKNRDNKTKNAFKIKREKYFNIN